MLNKSVFVDIKKELERLEANREIAIMKSRIIIRLSKQIIYALHRHDLKSAERLIKEIKSNKKLLEPYTDSSTDMPIIALQEYVEALAYYNFIVNNRIPNKEELGVPVEAYLGGLADLTGEFVRRALDDLINRKFKSAVRIKNLVEEIYGEFLKLDFRNNELRKKADSIKWNLNKLQEVIFEAGLKEENYVANNK